MRTHEIMSCPVHTVRDVDTIDQVAALLAGMNISAAPVLDRDGAVVGMADEGDLLRHYRAGEPVDPSVTATVGDVMSKPVFSVTPEADVAEVAETMLHHGAHSVPVIEDGRLVGIVSRHDLLRTLVGTDARLHREVQCRLDEYAEGERRWVTQVADRIAYITGEFVDDPERAVVAVLARSVPGVLDVETRTHPGERFACG